MMESEFINKDWLIGVCVCGLVSANENSLLNLPSWFEIIYLAESLSSDLSVSSCLIWSVSLHRHAQTLTDRYQCHLHERYLRGNGPSAGELSVSLLAALINHTLTHKLSSIPQAPLIPTWSGRSSSSTLSAVCSTSSLLLLIMPTSAALRPEKPIKTNNFLKWFSSPQLQIPKIRHLTLKLTFYSSINKIFEPKYILTNWCSWTRSEP